MRRAMVFSMAKTQTLIFRQAMAVEALASELMERDLFEEDIARIRQKTGVPKAAHAGVEQLHPL
jgi:hypothetical protein